MVAVGYGLALGPEIGLVEATQHRFVDAGQACAVRRDQVQKRGILGSSLLQGLPVQRDLEIVARIGRCRREAKSGQGQGLVKLCPALDLDRRLGGGRVPLATEDHHPPMVVGQVQLLQHGQDKVGIVASLESPAIGDEPNPGTLRQQVGQASGGGQHRRGGPQVDGEAMIGSSDDIFLVALLDGKGVVPPEIEHRGRAHGGGDAIAGLRLHLVAQVAEGQIVPPLLHIGRPGAGQPHIKGE